MQKRTILCHLLSALSFFPALLYGELVSFEIEKREAFADGEVFGDVGPYERIVGRAFFELDPDSPANRNIRDLDKAARNEHGKVGLSCDLFILAPKDPGKGNRSLLYAVNNRGNKSALGFFNHGGGGGNDPSTKDHAGNGFLMRHGFTIVWSGWDGELLPGNHRLRLWPPLAGSKENPITGMVRCEIVPKSDATRTVVNWDNHGSYRPTEKGIETATLSHRLLPGHPRVLVPRDNWRLHVGEVESGFPNQLPKVELELPGGLQKAHIYELIYEARDPLVMGTGFSSVRDLISSLKHGTGKANPLLHHGKPIIERAHGFGISQSGRFLREFLYWGFNADENNHKVFDGLIPHVSGSGMGSFNHRFAQPTRHAGQHDHHDYPPDRFPFAYGKQNDPLSGRHEGILDRSLESGTVPFILHTQSSSEYWNRSGSLVHTDPLGQEDAVIPDNVRLYFFGGTQHGPSRFPPKQGDGQTLPNPGDFKPYLRCLLLALDQWSKGGPAAPPSVYPKISAGTLVPWTQNATGFPAIPGIRYPGVIQQPSYLDFGPRWHNDGIIDHQPPIPRGDYQVLAPKSDADGNDLDCLAPPEVAVPMASYTGWRLRNREAGAENQLSALTGSYIPFPLTKKEREDSGDPRPSIEERYGSMDDYLAKLEAKCAALQKAGYLLQEDVVRTMAIQRERVEPLFRRTGEGEGKKEWAMMGKPADLEKVIHCWETVSAANSRQYQDEEEVRELERLRKMLGQKEEPITAKDLLGLRKVRSIQVDAYGVFKYPFFSCEFRERGKNLFFEKTTGSQRKSGMVFEDSPVRMVFLGAWTVNNEPQKPYSRLAAEMATEHDSVGVFIKRGGRIVALFPDDGGGYEMYEFSK